MLIIELIDKQIKIRETQMDNKQLIESLEYYTNRINEEDSKVSTIAKGAALGVGGNIVGKNVGDLISLSTKKGRREFDSLRKQKDKLNTAKYDASLHRKKLGRLKQQKAVSNLEGKAPIDRLKAYISGSKMIKSGNKGIQQEYTRLAQKYAPNVTKVRKLWGKVGAGAAVGAYALKKISDYNKENHNEQ